jgi:hypothetical protein
VDAAIDNAGYYQQLTAREDRTAIRWRPRPNPVERAPYYRARADFLLDDLVPAKDTMFLGHRFSTNWAGMRDREYQLLKPPSTYRIAMMGASSVMGWGVSDGETFEAVAELALDSIARVRDQRIEVLNFGILGTSLAQQVYRIETSAIRFDPDLVILTAQAYDLAFLQQHFQRVLTEGIPIPDSSLGVLVRGVGWDLRPVEKDIDRRLFEWGTEIAAPAGARVAVLGLTMPTEWSHGNLETTRRSAAAVGVPFLDCTRIWDGRSAIPFRVGGRDLHPNREGHRIIADCLVAQLREHARDLAIAPLVSADP